MWEHNFFVIFYRFFCENYFTTYRRIPLASPGLIHAHFGDLVSLYTGWAYTRMGLYTGLK